MSPSIEIMSSTLSMSLLAQTTYSCTPGYQKYSFISDASNSYMPSPTNLMALLFDRIL
jgi:hypothetical protein